MTAADEVVERLSEAGVVAVLRRLPMPVLEAALPSLWAGGLTVFEITMESPNAAQQIAWIQSHFPEALVGAGTVLTPETLETAAALQPGFLVSPHWDPALSDHARAADVPYFPGVFTPSEAAAAQARGHRAVKVFPASSGGPSHLRELHGPFPNLRFMPTGGITAENLRAYRDAGAFAVGVGSALLPPALVAAGEWAGVTAHVRRFLEAAH